MTRFPLTLALWFTLSSAFAAPLRGLYPEIAPYHTDYLRVSGGHEIYFEESGNPKGLPALALHGGPGTGSNPKYRRFFDPARYRIILFDQRGCGKSRPAGSIQGNTTRDLIDDMEALRGKLGIASWLIYGGSWGSTLALAYAEAHPDRVRALILRGIFLARPAELDWTFRPGGVDRIFPDAFQEFRAYIPKAEQGDLLQAYYARIFDSRRKVAAEAVKHWDELESVTEFLLPPKPETGEITDADINRARIESYYMIKGCFLGPDQLLKNLGAIRQIPAIIIQGRYDMTCPLRNAWDLHRAWPEAEFRVVPDASHSWREPGILNETILATDRFR